jgi:hypothetical protein
MKRTGDNNCRTRKKIKRDSTCKLKINQWLKRWKLSTPLPIRGKKKA